MESHSLAGEWEWECLDREVTAPASVPGDVYTDLIEAGAIDDPYRTDRELAVQWVGETDWVCRRTLVVEASTLDHERQVLVFEGIDTVARVVCNGDVLAEVENAFQVHRIDATDALVPGENDLEIRFRSPVAAAKRRRDADDVPLPATRYPVDQPARNYLRKPQYQFGWDWGPCLPTMGLYRPVRLEAYSDPTVTWVTTAQNHREGAVDLSVRVGIDAPTARSATLTASVDGHETRAAVDCPAGESVESLTVTVEDPDLWWPAGHGDQALSTLAVALDPGGRETRRIGFRDVALDRSADDRGERFAIVVNGRPIFARGANWIPADALPGRVTEDRVETLLESARAANMNTIRVWGGGVYESEQFYRRCDELGLLVWQDCMFACSAYPTDGEFLGSVRAEVRDQARRIGTHPSIALWCGSNENQMLIRELSGDVDPDRLAADYRTLFEGVIPEVLAEEDPARPYWPSSPSSGPRTDDPDDPSRGDVHVWDVWHEGAPFPAYRETEPRFASEFGYQSFPAVETLLDVLPEDALNPTHPLMEHHQRHPDGNRLILARMADHFRIPWSFEAFVRLSQLQQAIAMQTAIEHYRRLQPDCMGALFWQFDDVWPVASWSAIDHAGRWKALQHVLQRSFAPRLCSTVVSEEALAVHLINDRPEPFEGSLTVETRSLRGDQGPSHAFDASVPPGEAREVASIDRDTLLGSIPADRALVSTTGPDAVGSRDVPVPYKRMDLPDPEFDVAVEDERVTVRADAAALFVTVEGTDRPLLGNVRHLGQGESMTLRPFGNRAGIDSGDLRVTHLADWRDN